MKTNRLFFLFFSLLLSIGMALGRTNIPLVRDVPKGGGEDDKARALFPSPTAYLDNNLLVISLFIPDPIKVSIIGEDNNLRRHLDFSSSDEFIIDLKEQGMHSGVYTLRFLHYSIWWQGVFTLEGNGDITPGTQTSGIAVEYIDSTYYQLEGEKATIVRRADQIRSVPCATIRIASSFLRRLLTRTRRIRSPASEVMRSGGVMSLLQLRFPIRLRPSETAPSGIATCFGV